MEKKLDWEWDKKEEPIKIKRGQKPSPDLFCVGRQYFIDSGKLILWKRLVECGVTYKQLADTIKTTGLSLQILSNLVNHGIFPPAKKRQWYKEKIEAGLCSLRVPIDGIWDLLPDGEECDRDECAARKFNVRKTNGRREVIVRKEKILQQTKEHFKLVVDPFHRQEESVEKLFSFPGFRAAEDALMDAAHHAEFVAICGPSGSGKSTLIKKLVNNLTTEEKIVVILPRSFQKERLSVSAVCDAIVRTLSPSTPIKQNLEGKAWQVEGLLKKLYKTNMRAVLIIDEAHALTMQMLRFLKRFHEIEEGFVKLLGIILVGQEELDETLNEYTHHEIREVIKRCAKVKLTGLNGTVPEYLDHRFKMVGADVSSIFSQAALMALGKRETTPLDVNNLAAKAMNMACSLGEKKVTEEVVWHVTA